MSNGRTVSTDALETLGTIIDDTQKRDAIHLAVLPVQAGEDLRPGADVKLVGGKAFADDSASSIAIVDPFLPEGPGPGQWFWMVLRPRLVTSLRHVWSHPAFEDEVVLPVQPGRDKATSEAWLRDFCETADCPSYDKMISLIVGANGDDANGDDYPSVRIEDEFLSFDGATAHGEIPTEFWDHMETVTGRKFPTRPGLFSCSC